MARPKTTPTKPRPTTANTSAPRRLKPPKRYWYKPWTWFRRLPPPPYRPLPKARHMLLVVIRQLGRHWKLFGGIVLVYGVLNILLVRGLSGSSNLVGMRDTLNSLFAGNSGKFVGAFLSFTYLLSSSGSGNTNVSGVYQSLLLISVSLAFIWALRQVVARNEVRVRDSFYRGMYPLVPFVLVLLVMGLQLLPLLIGGSLYSTVVSGGIAIYWYEKLLFGLLFLVLGLWSLRMISGSIFALYIVTLPDMTPMKAIRTGKQLVYGRRLQIWRKLVFLPVAMLVVAAIIEVPLIMFVAPLAAWVFFGLSMAALAVLHAYLYGLYRELIDEK